MDDNNLLDKISHQKTRLLATISFAAANTNSYIDNDEMDLDDQKFVIPEGVRDQLIILKKNPSLFEVLTNFTVFEFDEVCEMVCPIIATHARTTVQPRCIFGKDPNLSTDQRLLAFVLYMKQDNTVVFNAHQWNLAKSSACDDAIFVASRINSGLSHEIRWLNPEEMRASGVRTEFQGCIGFIDATLVQICRQMSAELSERHKCCLMVGSRCMR